MRDCRHRSRPEASSQTAGEAARSRLPWAKAFTCALAAVAWLLSASAAGAEVQSKDQRRCADQLYQHGSKLVRVLSDNHRLCVRFAGKQRLDKLGIPPQEQTALACLTNDVKGVIARQTERLVEREGRHCLTAPSEQTPDFGYAGSGALRIGMEAAARDLVTDLLTASPDDAVVSEDSDRNGARCQHELVSLSGRLLRDLWKEARHVARNGLIGRQRQGGGDPQAPVRTAAGLLAEVRLALETDARLKLDKARTRLRAKVGRRCPETLTPLAELFPGACAGQATSVESLSDCAIARAELRFAQSLAAGGGLSMGCDLADDGVANESCVSPELVQHVLDRTGYGPDAWSVARIQALGPAAYIEEQLDPDALDDSSLESLLVASYPSIHMSFQDLRLNYPQGAGKGIPLKELAEAKIVRAALSHRQLAQVLLDFWFNHFNVMGASGSRRWDTIPYERDALRPRVLGPFRELVLAMTRAPAMADYLDNKRNIVGRINENFGRELLELHTVEVDGGYTETDVIETSRALTGWGVDIDEPDGFKYRASNHDEGAKTVMGLALPANGGEQDGIDLIDFLSIHPSTAEFITRELIVRFVGDEVPLTLHARAQARYLETGGDIEEVVRLILLSPEFLHSTAVRKTKVKRPHVLMAGVLRATGADAVAAADRIRRDGDDLGEELFKMDPPTGYPEISEFWTSPGALIQRFNALQSAARSKGGFSISYPVTGSESSAEIVDALAAMLFPVTGISDETRDAVSDFLDLVAGASDSNRVENAAALLLSAPEFLLH